MVAKQEKIDEPLGSDIGGRRRGPGIGTLLFAAGLGIGLGVLTAPEAGTKIRRRLRDRLETLGDDMADRLDGARDQLDELRETGGRIRRRARRELRHRRARLGRAGHERMRGVRARLAALEDRLENLGEEEEGEVMETRRGGVLGAALGIAVGAGVAYFLISEDAGPARSRVQEMAGDLRRQANDRWRSFRRGGSRAGDAAEAFADEI